MLNPAQALNMIVNFAKTHGLPIIQRNEFVVKTLQDLGLDPTQPLEDVDGLYVYALVEYGKDKDDDEPILQLLRKKEIKKAFWNAYSNQYPFGFLKEVNNKFLNWECQDWNTLGDKVRESKVDVRAELQKFGEVFISVAKRTNSPEIKDYPDWDLDEYPARFKALINEKIKVFCGREFLFEEFDNFIDNNPNGYFTVVGDAGMGKSSIAAKYVHDHKCPCYFNIRTDRPNRPELFLESIRKQLIKRYGLQNAETADLSTLLQKVSEKLADNEKLVIVVDALDEVEQDGGGNLLALPTTLPNRVYFLLTRRPYERNTKRLNVSPGVEMKELDLRASEYQGLSRDDVKKYIRFMVNEDQDYGDKLKNWIRGSNLKPEDFVEEVAEKSENNFMYLRYVLPDIAKGYYPDLSLTKLPDGLQDYYQQHWVRMGMEDQPQKHKVIVLFILVESQTPPTLELIAEYADQDECEVEDVLDEWVEYLRKQDIDGETCYSIYHASFLDFLKGQTKLKGTRKLFEEVNERMAASLYSDI